MHEKFLLQALDLAKKRRGFCAPNPSVGAVLVRNQQVISFGSHWQAGAPHAEQVALNQAQNEAKGATLYVTLEPCCHWGRTAPCSDLIIDSGIAEVIYGLDDPNSLVDGQGIQLLRAAGIHCRQLNLPVIDEFYRSYHHWQKTQRPWITAKLALSLDGKIAAEGGKPVAITGKDLQEYTHQCRSQADAILTTSVTLNHDNPQLNVRLAGETLKKTVYVLDRTLSLLENLQIYQTAAQLVILHACSEADSKIERYHEKGAHCVQIKGKDRLDLEQVIAYIGAQGHHDLWVEAGGRCFEALLQNSCINTALIYVSPKTLGKAAYPAFENAHDFLAQARHCDWQKIGQEVICRIEISP
ncbi:MAG: bifunctional diaminohydroxyphosphoribosylaminopyrimidine deaminase/5-amino-6-(5-phosphoribosylamino)uracil reductase RibD [Gammaproteobacteria bacterium]